MDRAVRAADNGRSEAGAPFSADDPARVADRAAGREKGGVGLSLRLIILTLVFALFAQALVFVPSVAAFRRSWLNDRLSAAQIAALVLEAAPDAEVPPAIEGKLLEGVGVMGIALSVGGARHLLSQDAMPAEIARTIDLRDAGWMEHMRDALADLVLPDGMAMRVIGAGMGDVAFVELIMDARPLRAAMLRFSARMAAISLLVWGVAAAALYVALMHFIVRPVRRLASHITAFEREPGNPARIIVPSGKRDEIGVAERALERMERTLATELRQQQRLAALGLAVAKISHELRNMLTAAQLVSDRLVEASDPVVQRLAPRLIATLDRAIAFCETALAYGKVREALPQRRRFRLLPLVEELRDSLGLGTRDDIRLVIDIPDDLVVMADSDQLFRVLLNLGRNAVQALEHAAGGVSGAGRGRITIAARAKSETVTIRVADNGPGLASHARERLFEAFSGTTRPGGSGLGLPIAAELVRLNGGTIALAETADGMETGTCFAISLPCGG
ncbi:MAG: sensor histidine kinase [Pseudochelatococcus sp.]|jgi:signal transduction histidine kinase|uniref:sensor histidine kinase n=1 Tax=Pseudochelatococcus sp. TaxID=2020869 RepID=UPI003D93AD5E